MTARVIRVKSKSSTPINHYHWAEGKQQVFIFMSVCKMKKIRKILVPIFLLTLGTTACPGVWAGEPVTKLERFELGENLTEHWARRKMARLGFRANFKRKIDRKFVQLEAQKSSDQGTHGLIITLCENHITGIYGELYGDQNIRHTSVQTWKHIRREGAFIRLNPRKEKGGHGFTVWMRSANHPGHRVGVIWLLFNKERVQWVRFLQGRLANRCGK